MPWVRLHAMKDYYDMARLVEEVPGAKGTFNYVPSLWDQIESLGRGEDLDRLEIVSRKPESSLDEEERLFVAKNGFSCQYDTMIRSSPRYDALYRKYSPDAGEPEAALQADEQTLRDILVWYHLAWCNRTLREREEISRLVEKDADFTFEEKIALLDTVRTFMKEIVAYHGRLETDGRIEISTTPYYHPILPILFDPESPRIACPGMILPKGGFSLAKDAETQIARAVARHRELFGRNPDGFWPSEGSVSPEVARQMAANGVKWIATDEENLRISLGKDRLTGKEKYRPYRYGGVHFFFRDHGLSDRIGFVYQRQDTDWCIADFLQHLGNIEKSLPDDGPYVVPVILDGENCWEHYPNQGKDFLLGLYRKLAEDPRFEMTTFREALDLFENAPELERLHSGSWIDANFTTWIGDPVKNRAWSYLYKARMAVMKALENGTVPDEKRTELMEHVYAAEGSDWFWWFGEGHTSSYDAHFDHLFRRRLEAIYRLLEISPPEHLFRPLDSRWKDRRSYILPTYRIHPEINGRINHYWEWQAAGTCYPLGGSMQRSEHKIEKLLFGFDRENLYFQIHSPLIRRKNEKHETAFELQFTKPVEKRFSLPLRDDAGDGRFDGGRFAVDQLLEVALPFASLGALLEPGDAIEFQVALIVDGREEEILPEGAPIRLPFPSETFDEENWYV